MSDKAKPEEIEAVFADLTPEEQAEAEQRAREALRKMLSTTPKAQ